MATTKSAGRISIRVLPDSSGFRRDLKKALDRIEKSMEVKIPIRLELDRGDLQKIKKQIEDLKITITPKVRLTVTKEELHQLKKKIEELDPVVQIGLDIAALVYNARMKYLTRPRTVTIIPVLSKTAVAGVAAALAALGGGRYLADLTDDWWDFLKDLDKNAPKIGSVVAGITGAVGTLLASLSTAVITGGDLISILKTGIMAPALLIGAGIAVGAFITVIKDLKERLKDLGPPFEKLQDKMSDAFWNEAEGPIRNLVKSLMPSLNTEMVKLAKNQGLVTAAFADAVRKNVTPARFADMMGKLQEATRLAVRWMDPMVSSLTNLGEVGSDYLPRLSTWIGDLLIKFDKWVQVNKDNGNLYRWMEEGIQGLKDLGGLIYETGRALGALNKIFQDAGGAGLSDWREAMKDVADTLNDPNFAKPMTEIFKGANESVKAIGRGLKALGPGLSEMATPLHDMLIAAGETIEAILENVGDIMENPRFGKGMTDMFEGMRDFVRELKPAMKPVSDFLGQLGTSLGTFLKELGKLTEKFLSAIAPIATGVLEKITPLMKPLRELGELIIDTVAPALERFVDVVLPVLVDFILNSVIPAVEDFTEFFAGPVIDQAITDLEKLIEPLKRFNEENQKTDKGTSAWKTFGEAVLNVWEFLKGVDDLFSGGSGGLFGDPNEDQGEWAKRWADEWNREMEVVRVAIEGAWENHLQPALETMWTAVGVWWKFKVEGTFKKFTSDLKGDLEDYGRTFEILGGIIQTALDTAWAKILVWGTINIIKPWNEFWAGIFKAPEKTKSDIEGLKMIDLSMLIPDIGLKLAEWKTKWDNFVTVMPIIGRAIIDGFLAGISEKWNGFLAWIKMKFDGFIIWVKGIFGIHSPSTVFAEIGGNLIAGLLEGITKAWNGLVTRVKNFLSNLGTEFSKKWEEIKTGATTKLNQLRDSLPTTLAGIKGKITTGLNNIKTEWDRKWTEAKDNVKTILDRTGISSAITNIKGKMGTSMEGFRQSWDSRWNTIKDNAPKILSWSNIKGSIAGLKTKMGEGMTGFRTSWESRWHTIKENAGRILSWSNVTGAIGTMRGKMTTSMNSLKIWWSGRWDSIKNVVPNVLGRIDVWGAMSDIKTDISTNWGRIKSMIDGWDLTWSGSSLMYDFGRGISNAFWDVYGNVSDLLRRLRDMFPFSPAKAGPFSGSGYTTHSGRALMRDFGDAIGDQAGYVAKKTAGVMSAMGVLDSYDSDLDEVVQEQIDNRPNVTVKSYNPVAEKTSTTIEKKANTIRLAGVL